MKHTIVLRIALFIWAVVFGISIHLFDLALKIVTVKESLLNAMVALLLIIISTGLLLLIAYHLSVDKESS